MKKIILLFTLISSFFVFQYSSAQVFHWAKQTDIHQSNYPGGKDIVKDNNGNVYVTGSFQGTLNFGSISLTSTGGEDIFIAKYDSLGTVLWAQKAGGSATGGVMDIGTSISTDQTGNVYVTGSFMCETITFDTITVTNNSSTYTSDIFIAKYNAAGAVQWVRTAGGLQDDNAESISTDASGNIYISGVFESDPATFGNNTISAIGNGNNLFIAKYDPLGTCLWVQKAGSTISLTCIVYNCVLNVSNSGDAYITGAYASSTISFDGNNYSAGGSYNLFIAKYTTNGVFQWVQTVVGANITPSIASKDIAIDNSGNAYITGWFTGTSAYGTSLPPNGGNWDYVVFIAKYDASGVFQWVKTGGGNGLDEGAGVSLDPAGNAYITGKLYGGAFSNNPNVMFDNIAVTVGGGEYPVFVAKYNPSGTIQWVLNNIGNFLQGNFYHYGISEAHAITVNNGNAYITGSTSAGIFGSDTLTEQGNANYRSLFVAKISQLITQPIAGSPLCAGASLNVPFTITSPFNSGNVFTAELSDSSGSFANPVSIGTLNGVNSGTIAATIPSNTLTGSIYRIRVKSSDPAGNGQMNTADLVINGLPTVVQSPDSITACVGDPVTFSVMAIGAGLSYQWQLDNGNGFSNLSNSGIYSNVTTSSLTISGVTANMSSYQYRCIVSGTCLPSATSSSATLTVNPVPVITSQPMDQTVCAGNGLSFSVTATNALSYQWQVNTGSGFYNLNNNYPYSNVTSATLSVSAGQSYMNNYSYRCLISGCFNSDAAILTVNTAPNITSQPTSKIECVGGNLTFNLSATGTNLTYQWKVNTGNGIFTNLTNGGMYSNVNTAILSISGITSSMTGYQYQCVITGVCPSPVTSYNAILTVQTPFALTSQPMDETVCANSSASFNVGVTGSGVTYIWQKNQSGFWSTVTNVYPYSGATTNTLMISSASLSMNGYMYRCIVQGSCHPNDTTTVVTLNTLAAPFISNQPVNQTSCSGGNVGFSVSADGPGLTYQWQADTSTGFYNLSNSGIYSGVTTASLNITGVSSGMDGYQYRCLITGCSSNSTSNSVLLTINNSTITISSQPANQTVCEGEDVTFGFTANGSLLSYQWQENTGSGFYNLNNNNSYSGAYMNTLNIYNLSASINGAFYRCIISGCTVSDTVALTINSLPSVSLSSFTNVCANAPAFSLTGGLPVGGVYSGTGISGNNFTPATAGAGTHTINYTYSDVNGCTNSASQLLTVNSVPVVSYTEYQSLVCLSFPTLTLSSASPVGGIYSGDGVQGNTFNPSTAGYGTHSITYSYTGSNTCSNTVTQTIFVDMCTGIKDKGKIDDPEFKIYPNPFGVSITLDLAEDAEVILYNILGAQMMSWKINNKTTIIETEHLPSGIYLMQVKMHEKTITKRVIKE